MLEAIAVWCVLQGAVEDPRISGTGERYTVKSDTLYKEVPAENALGCVDAAIAYMLDRCPLHRDFRPTLTKKPLKWVWRCGRYPDELDSDTSASTASITMSPYLGSGEKPRYDLYFDYVEAELRGAGRKEGDPKHGRKERDCD